MEKVFLFLVAKWNWLEEGKEINFTVEEGKNGVNVLVDYVIET